MPKKLTIDVTVGGADCSGDYHWTAEELEAVAKVFTRAALAIRGGESGMVRVEHPDGFELAAVGIYRDSKAEDFEDSDYVAPVIAEFPYPARGGKT